VPRRPQHAAVFVVAEQNRGWILDGICRDLVARIPGSVIWYDDRRGAMPSGASYFFSHMSLFVERARQVRRSSRVAVLFTHPSRPITSEDRRALRLRQPSVLCMSSEGRTFLLEGGVDSSLISQVIPGVDPTRFQPHARNGGMVGLCSAYYERKNPEVMFDIVRTAAHERFVLVGRGWKTSPWADVVSGLPNLRYVEAHYADYPALYDQMDVFISPSTLEGGPMPLLEAMMSNVVPIATRTGFAPDLIEHGVNGLLVETTSSATEFADLIPIARTLTADIRSSVEGHTLDAYAERVAMALRVPQ
jgi:glycosyltransferase involved in cell wall biosynthesis